MDQIIEIAAFVATGAAWGMFWLASLGLFKKSLLNGELLQLLIYLFIISAGITAYAFFKDLYGTYSAADAAGKELFLSKYKGKDGLILIAKLVVTASPILFLLKPVKSLKILVAIVAACYVLIPYHQDIIDYVSK